MSRYSVRTFSPPQRLGPGGVGRGWATHVGCRFAVTFRRCPHSVGEVLRAWPWGWAACAAPAFPAPTTRSLPAPLVNQVRVGPRAPAPEAPRTDGLPAYLPGRAPLLWADRAGRAAATPYADVRPAHGTVWTSAPRGHRASSVSVLRARQRTVGVVRAHLASPCGARLRAGQPTILVHSPSSSISRSAQKRSTRRRIEPLYG